MPGDSQRKNLSDEGETWSEDQVGRGSLQIDGLIMYTPHLLVQSYLMPGSLKVKLGELLDTSSLFSMGPH